MLEVLRPSRPPRMVLEPYLMRVSLVISAHYIPVSCYVIKTRPPIKVEMLCKVVHYVENGLSYLFTTRISDNTMQCHAGSLICNSIMLIFIQ